MQAVSKIVEMPNNRNINTLYIESMLRKRNIVPLRWAIVSVSDKIIKLSVAMLIRKDG